MTTTNGFEQKLNDFEKQIKALHSQLKKQNQTIETLMQPKQATPKQLAMIEQIKKEHEILSKRDPKEFMERFLKKGSKIFENHVIKEDGTIEIQSSVAMLTATHYYLQPWANAGDIGSPIPETIVSSVNYPQGWTGLYSLPYPTNPDALAVTRTAWNRAMLDATLNIQEYQQWSTANFITTSDNGGTAYSYSMYARTLYDDGVNGPRTFISKTNTNTALPSNSGAIPAGWFLNDISTLRVVTDNATFAGGVTNGQAVYSNAGTFTAAIANGTVAQQVVGFADVSNSRVVTLGQCGLLSGLTAGSVYYLSSSSAGAITATKPNNNIVSVGVALSTTALLINIQEVPQLASAVARMYITGAQTITNAPVLIDFDTVDFDPASIIDIGSSRIVPVVPGYYRFTLQVTGDTGNNQNLGSQVRLNGTAIRNGWTYNGNASGGAYVLPSLTITDLVLMNGSTDYLDATITWSGGSGSDYPVQTGSTYTYMTVELVQAT